MTDYEEEIRRNLENDWGDLHPNLWRPQRGDLAHHLFVAKGTHVVQS